MMRKLFPIVATAFVFSGCGDATRPEDRASTQVEESTASAEAQKAFGDLSAMQGLEKMRAMLKEQPTLVHARINGPNDERPLHWASLSGSVEVVSLLIESGAAINAEDAVGMTPLHWAAWQGKVDVVKLLVSKGAQVNAVNNAKQTPLDRAINDKHHEVAKYLESLGGKKGAALN